MKKNIICLSAVLIQLVACNINQLYAQENIGMSSGNYAGVTGVWYNPASIADSRYKFDINIIGINSYFNNNYLLVKNGAFVRRLFRKEPYNGSFDAVKNDLLQEQLPVNGKVYGRVESNIHFPLSFMATTGKRSAIAITMNNRTINKVDNLNTDLARSFFGELRDSTLYGKNMQLDSTQYNFLNWQEVGFTYSRVMMSSKHHLLKMGVTLKWLGANAAAYIQTDNAIVSFRDSQTLSLRTPLMHYARTANADIGQFNRRDIFNNIEDQTFGWDAGLVYEFRAKVKKFRYVDEENNEEQRRDLNKYMFRIGLSLVDMGRFTLNKKPLTNDFSANIVNWNFSDVHASNLSDFDTALAKQVNYIPGASSTFTYRLPAALIANFDLHLFGGFYINVAAKAPFESFKKTTDTYISANKWVAITPRFEGKFFGIYVPVTRAYNRTNIGATVKLGPVYLGSNNLAQILSNPSSYEADFHAGVRLSIPYGKPSKLSKYAQSILNGNKDQSATQVQLDSLKREVEWLKRSLYDSSKTKPVQIFITNDGVTSQVDRKNGDSILIRNNTSEQQRQQQEVYSRQYETNTDTLVRQLAEKNIEIDRLKKSINEENKKGTKKERERKSKNEVTKVQTSDPEMEKEVERIRKQMQIQNAALIGGGTAAVIATSNNKDKKPAEAATVKKDSLSKDSSIVIPVYKTDTIYIRDTIRVKEDVLDDVAFRFVKDQNFAPILFANGSTVINATDKKRLQQLAGETKQRADWRLEITGMTDSKGSVTANRKIAAQRASAVTGILLQNGVKENQIIIRSKLADTSNIPVSENQRRIEIRVLSKK